MWPLALQVLVCIGYVAGTTLLAGAVAPRVPKWFVESDRWLLSTARWETPRLYRALRASSLSRILPEAGAAFGGVSKAHLPGTDRESLAVYLCEVRRAEWVHWASTLLSLGLFVLVVWWLALAFVVVVGVVNAAFIVILRHNRLRIQCIIDRSGA